MTAEEFFKSQLITDANSVIDKYAHKYSRGNMIKFAEAYLDNFITNNKQMAKTLKQQYKEIVTKYIDIFCEKQEVCFEYWIANQIGGIACFGDVLIFNFTDIVYDINTNQPKHLIIDWIYESVDNPHKSINYYSYSKGLRHKQIKS